jgi:hypothetical protein
VRRFTELERGARGGDARARLAERVRDVLAKQEAANAGVVDEAAKTLRASPPSLSDLSVVPTTPDTPMRNIARSADLEPGAVTEPEPISPAKIKSSAESSANLVGLREDTGSRSRKRRSSSVKVPVKDDEGAARGYWFGAGIGIAIVAVFVLVMLALR